MYALITGASSGIGREMAILLGRQGYDLILVARRTDRLLKLQEKLAKHMDIQVLIKPYNLSERKNCIQLHEECKGLDVRIVVNNAGFGKVGDSFVLPLEEELEMIDTNIVAVHTLTKLFAKTMIKGNILNVASIAAFYPIPLMSTYGATKSYVVNYSKACNYELKRQGKPVHVSVLCPGPVDTEFDQVANVTQSLGNISARECAKAGLQGMFAGKTLIYPKKMTGMLAMISGMLPDAIILPVEYYLQNKKRKKS